jgi:hypothetical protein
MATTFTTSLATAGVLALTLTQAPNNKFFAVDDWDPTKNLIENLNAQSVTGSSAATRTGLVPFGAPLAVTGLQVFASSGSITFSWNESVGSISNGSAIASFAYTVNGQLFSTTSHSVTISATNGVSYTIAVAAKNGANAVGPYSTAAPLTPVGAPSIIGVSVTGKVVSLNFNPNGSSLLGYDVIGIPSSFTAGDTLFLTSTPSAVAAYSSSASQSFSMSFDFSTLVQAAGLKNAFIYILTSNGSYATSVWGSKIAALATMHTPCTHRRLSTTLILGHNPTRLRETLQIFT